MESSSQIARRVVEQIIDNLPDVPIPVTGSDGAGTDQVLSPDNVFELCLAGDAKAIIRPSGTEPKMKAYFSVRESSRAEAERKFEAFSAAVKDLLG